MINKVHFSDCWTKEKFWNKTRKRRQDVLDQITPMRLKLSQQTQRLTIEMLTINKAVFS